MRNALLFIFAALGSGTGPASAQPVASPPLAEAPAPNRDAALGMETFRLWQTRAPQATGDSPDEVPTLTLFRPQQGQENGTAVIIAPGGGYFGLSSILEGRDVASWFTAHAITAFVLTYRVGLKARLPIPLLDGARAVRLVRANAARWHIAPDRIGMVGFSAGGHLAASVAGLATAGDTRSADPVEQVSSRPDFEVLGYPWLEATTVDAQGNSPYCRFARSSCNPADYARYHPVELVTDSFPPTFIYHTTADTVVKADGSLKFYQALVAHHVPVEMHIFANGAHGTGLGGADPALSHWPELLAEWLRGMGLLDQAALHKP
jgi:acetyl esterase/lipase